MTISSTKKGGSGNSGSVSVMTGATSSTNGSSGSVPAPVAGEETKLLKGDGTWDYIKNILGDTGSVGGHNFMDIANYRLIWGYTDISGNTSQTIAVSGMNGNPSFVVANLDLDSGYEGNVYITATSPTGFTIRKSSEVLDAHNPRLRWALLVFSPNAVVEGGGD